MNPPQDFTRKTLILCIMERPSFWKFRETRGDEYQSGPETSMIQYGRPNKGQTKVGNFITVITAFHLQAF